ncbi:MAG: sigma factor-like helix-turn-helix DNA-binding protein [Solirubrobacteraceae bacterium]
MEAFTTGVTVGNAGPARINVRELARFLRWDLEAVIAGLQEASRQEALLLDASPFASIPEDGLDVVQATLGQIDLEQIDFEQIDLGQIDLGQIDLEQIYFERIAIDMGEAECLDEADEADVHEDGGDSRPKPFVDASRIFASGQDLSKRERLVLYLRFEERRSQADIALRLGVSEESVADLIRRAVPRLRACAGSCAAA